MTKKEQEIKKTILAYFEKEKTNFHIFAVGVLEGWSYYQDIKLLIDHLNDLGIIIFYLQDVSTDCDSWLEARVWVKTKYSDFTAIYNNDICLLCEDDDLDALVDAIYCADNEARQLEKAIKANGKKEVKK